MDEWLNVSDLSRYLRIKAKTLYAMIESSNGPPCFRVGRLLLFRRSEIDSWMEGKRETGCAVAGAGAAAAEIARRAIESVHRRESEKQAGNGNHQETIHEPGIP